MRVAELSAFEDRALAVAGDYATVGRHQSPTLVAGEASERPAEVHLVTFRDAAAFAAYSADSRNGALAARREGPVLRTTVVRLD